MTTIKKYDMLSQGETIVLAISGGVDSMVMLHLFVDIAKTFDLTVIVAHLNHNVRADAALDLALVQRVATEMGFSFEQDILPPMGAVGNFHAYARQWRYEFFARVADRHGATKVATGHHADDHLETVVDRMMRTANPASLIGIKPVSQMAGLAVVRPLLDLSIAEIEDFARAHAVAFREDSSNLSAVYLRNRIRRQIVPLLKAERPDVIHHVRDLAKNLHDDEQFFTEQIDQLMAQVAETEVGYQLDVKWLATLQPSLQRRLIIKMIPHISQGAIHDLTAWLDTNQPNSQLDVGHHTVVKRAYDVLVVERFGHTKITSENYDLELPVGSEVVLPDGRKLILRKNCAKRGTNGTYLCYNSLCMPLRVRTRRAGDRIGSVKVKKLMIDAKIPLDDRDSWPVVVDANDVVIWIPGLKKSAICLATAESEADLWIEILETEGFNNGKQK